MDNPEHTQPVSVFSPFLEDALWVSVSHAIPADTRQKGEKGRFSHRFPEHTRPVAGYGAEKDRIPEHIRPFQGCWYPMNEFYTKIFIGPGLGEKIPEHTRPPGMHSFTISF